MWGKIRAQLRLPFNKKKKNSYFWALILKLIYARGREWEEEEERKTVRVREMGGRERKKASDNIHTKQRPRVD